MSDPAAEGWHADRRIPVAVLLGLIVQTMTVVWWVSGLSSTVVNNTNNIEAVERQVEALRTDRREMFDRLVRVEETVKTSQRLLEQISKKLED